MGNAQSSVFLVGSGKVLAIVDRPFLAAVPSGVLVSHRFMQVCSSFASVFR